MQLPHAVAGTANRNMSSVCPFGTGFRSNPARPQGAPPSVPDPALRDESLSAEPLLESRDLLLEVASTRIFRCSNSGAASPCRASPRPPTSAARAVESALDAVQPLLHTLQSRDQHVVLGLEHVEALGQRIVAGLHLVPEPTLRGSDGVAHNAPNVRQHASRWKCVSVASVIGSSGISFSAWTWLQQPERAGLVLADLLVNFLPVSVHVSPRVDEVGCPERGVAVRSSPPYSRGDGTPRAPTPESSSFAMRAEPPQAPGVFSIPGLASMTSRASCNDVGILGLDIAGRASYSSWGVMLSFSPEGGGPLGGR